MPVLQRLHDLIIGIALIFAGLAITPSPAHAISDSALYQACAHAESSGTHRRAAQIRNFRFAYEINRAQRDTHGIPLSMEAVAIARARLIEVCEISPETRTARG